MMPCSAGASSARGVLPSPASTPRRPLARRSRGGPLSLSASPPRAPCGSRVVPGALPGARAVLVRASSATTTTAPPALANPESGSRAGEFATRVGAVPYKDEALDRVIHVNAGATEAIERCDAGRFVRVIDPSDPKLVALLEIMEAGWDRVGVRAKNAGHHTLWPEAFEAGAALLRECFPEECDPKFGGEVLSGVAFVDDEHKDRAIDFMQRRPKTDFTMSKYNPLGRLHRDPDAIDYKSPGWMESAMPGSRKTDAEGYAYRYYNVWLARTPLDPSGQVWENPLCVLLPRDGGAREWDYEVRTPEDNEGQKEETAGEALKRVAANPIAAAPIIMKAFSFKKKNKEDQFEFTDANYMKRGSPELTPSDDHVWVTAPFVAFDSFDLWHGAAKWDGDAKGELCNAARDVMRARQEAAKGRVSMELRFRARYKPEKSEGGRPGVPFSPLTAAYRGGAFTPDTVRPSGGAYDLLNGDLRKEA